MFLCFLTALHIWPRQAAQIVCKDSVFYVLDMKGNNNTLQNTLVRIVSLFQLATEKGKHKDVKYVTWRVSATREIASQHFV